MSIPYTSGDFTSARANGESWVEYPFIEYGDNTTKVYHLVCEVNEADYAPIALDTTMANASNADVISLPFTADAAAYHVGDFGKSKDRRRLNSIRSAVCKYTAASGGSGWV